MSAEVRTYEVPVAPTMGWQFPPKGCNGATGTRS